MDQSKPLPPAATTCASSCARSSCVYPVTHKHSPLNAGSRYPSSTGSPAAKVLHDSCHPAKLQAVCPDYLTPRDAEAAGQEHAEEQKQEQEQEQEEKEEKEEEEED